MYFQSVSQADNIDHLFRKEKILIVIKARYFALKKKKRYFSKKKRKRKMGRDCKVGLTDWILSRR